jgi:hypothetical protein
VNQTLRHFAEALRVALVTESLLSTSSAGTSAVAAHRQVPSLTNLFGMQVKQRGESTRSGIGALASQR